MNRHLILEKLGEQKLKELRDKIENCQVALDVIREEFENIKKELPKFRKTKDSNSVKPKVVD